MTSLFAGMAELGPWGHWLLGNSLAAAALAALTLAIGRFLRPAPAVMHLLWLFVLLKLAMPPLFAVPIDLPAEPPRVVVVDPMVLAAASPTPAPGLAPLPPRTEIDWPATLALVWGGGALALLALYLLGIARSHRRVRGLLPAPVWVQREVEAMAAQLGMRAPRVLDDPHSHAPCIWSLFGTRLLVPLHTLAATPQKGRAAVLAHELAHLRRRDHLTAQLELLLAIALWWHPLFWFARARLRLWAELACDAWAVASVPDAQLEYAGVLIDAVTAPDSAVPGLTVLAARPAARAAFERRLTMILNENVACRVSRGWWLPMVALATGLSTAPVLAQREAEPVRIEVKVNGHDLDELTPEERRTVLKLLLRSQGEREVATEAEAEDAPAPREKPKSKPKQPKPKAKAKLRAGDAGEGFSIALEGMPSAGELHSLIAGGLQEARAEILADDDLRELGIQDEVVELLDRIGDGKDLGGSLDSLLGAALRGAGKLAIREIHADEDLQELGIADGLGTLVEKLLDDEDTQELLSGLIRQAAGSALHEAKVEILDDSDLQELGIAEDVAGLLEGLLDGGKGGDGGFAERLHGVIEKAMHGALHGQHGQLRAKVRIEVDGEDDDAKPAPEAPKPVQPRQPKQKKGKKAKIV